MVSVGGSDLGELNLLPDFNSAISLASYVATVVLVALIFCMTFISLKYLFFSPVVSRLHLRGKNINEVEALAQKLSRENSELIGEYEWRMGGALELAEEKTDVARLMGKRRAEMILDEAKRMTRSDLENVISGAEASFQTVISSVEGEVAQLAKDIVSKILTS